ncbi:o-succinylbenzoate--CoA ligase [Longivirga aurantiaca]|uniref:O-succinylbenzoate--CoA ligase n=1 Tax=Longivirga aurantiaca TaxID=1837743 RepID=A0ABW1SXT5_9ACTN
MNPSTSRPDRARDLLAEADPVAAFVTAHEAGDDVLLRTSGTSGTPRIVRRSTWSWVDSFAPVESLTGLARTSRAWIPAPVTGTMNLFAAVHARFLGADVVDEPHAATHWFLTPSALHDVLDTGERFDGVHAVVAGDRLGIALHDRASAAGLRVSHYYGAAELSFVAWGTHEDDLTAFPGVELEVRDGVVWVRSAYVSSGYVDGDGPFLQGADRFATVGDRGSLADGRLQVHGRDDVVLTGGATVHVADVEGCLRAGATGALAVVGIPHPRLGAVVAAALEHRDDVEPLRTTSRAQLAASHRPRRWFVLTPFPLTAAGKVDRAAVTARIAAGDGVEVAP